jgi:hypothetical protein
MQANCSGRRRESLPFLTGIMASKIEQPANLRLCPICANEDKKAYGEPY